MRRHRPSLSKITYELYKYSVNRKHGRFNRFFKPTEDCLSRTNKINHGFLKSIVGEDSVPFVPREPTVKTRNISIA